MTLTAEQQSYVRAVVGQIERIEEQIKMLNADKSDEYKGAKAIGLDVKALRKFIAKRRDPNAAQTDDALTDIEHAMEAAPRACTREEAA